MTHGASVSRLGIVESSSVSVSAISYLRDHDISSDMPPVSTPQGSTAHRRFRRMRHRSTRPRGLAHRRKMERRGQGRREDRSEGAAREDCSQLPLKTVDAALACNLPIFARNSIANKGEAEREELTKKCRKILVSLSGRGQPITGNYPVTPSIQYSRRISAEDFLERSSGGHVNTVGMVSEWKKGTHGRGMVAVAHNGSCRRSSLPASHHRPIAFENANAIAYGAPLCAWRRSGICGSPHRTWKTAKALLLSCCTSLARLSGPVPRTIIPSCARLLT